MSNGRTLRAAAVMILLALAAITGVSDARAESAPYPCSLVTDPNDYPSTNPRVDHFEVAGVDVNVLVPPQYRTNNRRYPVVYLFHGAFGDQDSFTSQTDVIDFTAGMPDGHQAIVVMPDGGHLPAASDWVDRTHLQESYFIDTLLPFIDQHYRTFGDRAHRAAAGFSGGGLDAMLYAARHPDLFVAAGSFSGFVDQLNPPGPSVIQLFAGYETSLCADPTEWTGIWGDPSIHPMGWESHDPTKLASSLEDVSLYMASGNGQQCPGGPPPDPLNAEGVVYAMSLNLDAALTAEDIPHIADFYGCGVHLYSNASRDLTYWWPQMLAALGTEPPAEFDYRTGETTATVWGWTFTADPARAPEFLDIHHASVSGVELTGSGTTTVTTGPVFHQGQRVVVSGAGGPAAVLFADSEGRLTFSVDLGPAHTLEQDTAAEISAAAQDPNYFITREVSFSLTTDAGSG